MARSPSIAAFVDAMTAYNARQDGAISDLQGDIDTLNNQIRELQNSAGQIDAADQAMLDNIQDQAKKISDKLDALDALTPPVTPPVVVDPADPAVNPPVTPTP